MYMCSFKCCAALTVLAYILMYIRMYLRTYIVCLYLFQITYPLLTYH